MRMIRQLLRRLRFRRQTKSVPPPRLEDYNSLALAWLSWEMAQISLEEPSDRMSRYDDRTIGENIIETDNGPLVAPDVIFRLENLLARHESGLLAPSEWLDPIGRTKSTVIRALIGLELSMVPELHKYRGPAYEISFRKGGVIVWREKPEARAA